MLLAQAENEELRERQNSGIRHSIEIEGQEEQGEIRPTTLLDPDPDKKIWDERRSENRSSAPHKNRRKERDRR